MIRENAIYIIFLLALCGSVVFALQGVSKTNQIATCGNSCQTGGLSMQSYSEKDGCKCMSKGN